jgi:hypothetical protein
MGGVENILKEFGINKLLQNSLNRYLFEPAELDDVRSGLARVNSRGKIKWLPIKKIKPISLRNRVSARLFAKPLLRRINYSEIAKNLIVVQPMPDGANLIYFGGTINDKNTL